MNKHLQYEKLVAHIYSLTSKNCTVKHNDSIYGHNSGTMRQIDISVSSKAGLHKILTIIECKDQSRKVDVNTVGAFHSVIDDVKASKGVLICNKGFTSSAIKLAKKYNIDLCSLHDAMSKDWKLVSKIPIIVRTLTPYVVIELKNTIEIKDKESFINEVMETSYGNFYKWFTGLWVRGELAANNEYSYEFNNKENILKAVFDPKFYNNLILTKAGYVFDKDSYAGFADELPSSKGIYNISSNEYMLAYSALEVMGVNTDSYKETQFTPEVHGNHVILYCVGEPIFAVN